MKFDKDKIISVLARISNQRHLNAIRNGMSTIIPVVILGSFFTILLNVPNDNFQAMIAPFAEKIAVPMTFSVNFMSVFVTFGVAYYLAGEYKKVDQLSTSILSVLGFLIAAVSPEVISKTAAKAAKITSGTYLPVGSFGASGLFTAILCGIFTVEVVNFFINHNLVIRLPKGVPPAVIHSFTALIPGVIVVAVAWILRQGLGFDINTALQTIFSPIGMFGKDNLASVVVPILLISIVWLFGIHGMIIATPILFPYWYGNLDANIAAVASKNTVPHFMTEQFFQWFVWIGGCGTLLSLTILMAFVGKSKYMSSLGKISLGPLIFNIAEPIVFGVPIILNPIFAIPFVLAPIASGIITYLAMGVFHLVNYPIAVPPWVLPAPIGAYIATGFDWRAVVLSLVNIVVGIVIYFPFFKYFDKEQVKKEQLAEI